MLEQLLASAITLTVENKDSGATVDLTQGTLVQSGPESPGEYSIATNDDRDTITVQFFNQIQDGRSLQESGNYGVVVEVKQNEYLVTESLTRDVTVLSEK